MVSDKKWAPRGRPVLGAVFGLLFGVLATIDFLLAGTFPLQATPVAIIPPAMSLLGLLLGWWAPLPRRIRRQTLHDEDDLTIFGQRRSTELRTLADDRAEA